MASRVEPVNGWGRVVWVQSHDADGRWKQVPMGLVIWNETTPPVAVYVNSMRIFTAKWPDVNQILPVRFAPGAFDDVEIDWDRVPTLRDRVLAAGTRIAEQMRAQAAAQAANQPTG